MKIAGMERVSLIDYKDKVSAVVFLSGCNLKCLYCHNADIIGGCGECIEFDEVMEYLEKRKGILDGVVISGGEPTLNKDLKKMLKRIKGIGYEIKLDTNGLQHRVVEDVLKEKLVDYIAVDIKNSIDQYKEITGVKNVATDNLLNTIRIVKESGVEHEFRTTVCKEYHSDGQLEKITELIGDSDLYLQNFYDNGVVEMHKLTPLEMQDVSEVMDRHSNVFLRGDFN